MAPKRKRTAAAPTAKKRRTAAGSRSVAPDDGNTHVPDVPLPISSVSVRRPPPDGLQSLTRCAQLAASRHFKRAWEGGNGGGEKWEADWACLDDRFKDEIRDNAYRAWGNFLTEDILQATFVHPPHLWLPGDVLPVMRKTSDLAHFRPPDAMRPLFTRLTIKHAPKVSDLAIATLIHFLPNLEEVNLKGCTLAGSKTVETIVKLSPKLRRINLKGTSVGEREAKMILDTFPKQIEGFKIDNVDFEDLDAVLASKPFPRLTHLCMPSDKALRSATLRLRPTGLSPWLDPNPSIRDYFDWKMFFNMFPVVTHLSLPGWMCEEHLHYDYEAERVGSGQIIKFSVAPGGGGLSDESVIHLIQGNRATLETLHLGHLKISYYYSTLLGMLVDIAYEISRCPRLRSLRMEVDPIGSGQGLRETKIAKEALTDLYFFAWTNYPWPRLKELSLAWPLTPTGPTYEADRPRRALENYCDWKREIGSPVGPGDRSTLEVLNLRGINLQDSAGFARRCATYPNLKELDLTGSLVTTEDLYTILDHCPKLHRIDLTSCRRIDEKDRGNIFEAHALARLGAAPEPDRP